MTDKTELLRLADALESAFTTGRFIDYTCTEAPAILRKLAEQEKIGRIAANLQGVFRQEVMLYTEKLLPIGTPLYASPVPKEKS